MQVEILRPRLMSPETMETWAGLQRSSLDLASPFLSPHWPRAVERAMEAPDCGVRVAVFHDGGHPRGFLAVRVAGSAAMPAGAPLADYQGLVVEPGLTVDPRGLVRALGVGRYDFTHMPVGQAAFAPFARGRTLSWILDISHGYAAWAAAKRESGTTLPRDLDKKRRKAAREAGPVVFAARSPDRAAFERLFAWKRAQLCATGQVDVFSGGWPARLMRELHSRPEPGCGGALFTLSIGGALAAAQFHLLGERTVHAWVIAHDPAFERYSPGLLLFQEILRWAPGAGFVRLDLGAGDYRFKRDLATGALTVMHGYVGVGSTAAFVRGAAYGVRAAAESLPLGPFSALPGKAMRRFDALRGLR